VRIALVVPRSMDDDAIRDAAAETYRELVAEGHDVDCFVVADPSTVEGFTGEARTRLCVVDHGFRSEQWSRRPPTIASAAEAVMVRVAASRLRALLARADRRAGYDAVIEPRWSR
jgi:hypothetical protein